MLLNDFFSQSHLFNPNKLSTMVDNDLFMCLALSMNLKL